MKNLLSPTLSATMLLCFSLAAQGQSSYLKLEEFEDKLRFGSEMTISSDELVKSFPKDGNDVQVMSPLSNQLLGKMRESLRKKYQNSRANSPFIEDKSFHSNWSRGAYSLHYPNDFTLTVFSDPGVFEMNSSPSSLKTLEANQHLIQQDFLEEGKKLGLEPALFTGSGHIHIEVSKLHPVTIRNFLADFFNATGLASGALNEDVFNSIGVGEIPESNKSELRKAFLEFDRTPNPKSHEIPKLVSQAYKIRFIDDLPEYQEARNRARPDKYFAVSFRSFINLGTIEIRSIRPQASAQSYLKLARLFVARMKVAERNRLNGVRTPIGNLRSLRGKPQEILAQFDQYVSEAGLEFRDYVEFVLPWWQLKGSEVETYLNQRSQSPLSCQSVHGA